MVDLPKSIEKLNFSLSNSPSEHIAFFKNLYRRGIVTLYLLRDSRVDMIHKIIPAAALIYILSPIDILPEIALGPIGAIDDVFLMMFAIDWFVQLAPPEVVLEIAERLGYTEPVDQLSSTAETEDIEEIEISLDD